MNEVVTTEGEAISPNKPRKEQRVGSCSPSLFSFYIHDSTEYFRIELVGELAEACVSELIACWCTAKDTIAGRKLVLDVRGLKAIDEIGRHWIEAMAREGALFVTNRKRASGFVLESNWTPVSEDTRRSIWFRPLRFWARPASPAVDNNGPRVPDASLTRCRS